MTSDLQAGDDTGWPSIIWSHEYNSKMEMSSESPKDECQHIWGKVILQHANRALVLVPHAKTDMGQKGRCSQENTVSTALFLRVNSTRRHDTRTFWGVGGLPLIWFGHSFINKSYVPALGCNGETGS